MNTVVFPARAGMSPLSAGELLRRVGFPRPRGDEPLYRLLITIEVKFSPPARG